jgi:flagellar biosynthetic protein FliQ
VNADTAIALGRQVLIEALTLMAPVLGVSLAVGVLVALAQALTSLQEQTVAMVPKLLALVAALFFLAPWILRELVDFALRILGNLARYGSGA